jgi:hypothetical protein
VSVPPIVPCLCVFSKIAPDHTISGNGPKDRTQEICQHYAAKDDRIQYLRQDRNRGAGWNHTEVPKTRAHHTSAGTPTTIGWIRSAPRLCAAVLDANPQTILVWPLTAVIDRAGEVSYEYRNDLPFDNSTPTTRLRSPQGPKTEKTLLHMCYPILMTISRSAWLWARRSSSASAK